MILIASVDFETLPQHLQYPEIGNYAYCQSGRRLRPYSENFLDWAIQKMRLGRNSYTTFFWRTTLVSIYSRPPCGIRASP